MKRSPALGFIFVTLLIDVLGFGLVIPIMPKFIATLSGKGLAGGARDYGLLLALFGAMQFIFSPVLGALSDRYGRRPVLLLSMFFSGVDYVVLATAPNLSWLYVGRILAGITGASFAAASAYIVDVSPPEKRSQNFGLIGAAFGIGFILGPAIGGALGGFGPRLPFWVAAGLCLTNFLYGALVLPESLSPENRRTLTLRDANPLVSLGILVRYPVVWSLSGALIASNLAATCMQSTWVLYTGKRFGWTVTDSGISLAVIGVLALVFQVGLARVLLPKLGDRRVMLLAMGVAVVQYLGYAMAYHGWMMYVIMVVCGLTFLAGQATQGYLTQQVGADEQGTLQGGLTSLQSLTGIFGPVIATNLFAHFNSPSTAVQVPGAAFYFAALLSLVALVLAYRALLKHRTSRSAEGSPALPSH